MNSDKKQVSGEPFMFLVTVNRRGRFPGRGAHACRFNAGPPAGRTSIEKSGATESRAAQGSGAPGSRQAKNRRAGKDYNYLVLRRCFRLVGDRVTGLSFQVP